VTQRKIIKEAQIPMVEIPNQVHIQGPLLGMVPTSSSWNYNIQDEAQFLELCFNAYTKILEGGKVVAKPWTKPIYKSRDYDIIGCPPLWAPEHQLMCSFLTQQVAWRIPLAGPHIPSRHRNNAPSLGPSQTGEDPTDVVMA
jgi:hypothetical protein